MLTIKNLSRLVPIAIVVVGAIAFFVLGLNPVTVKDWLDSFGPAAPVMFIAAGVMMMSVCVPKTIMSMIAGALFGTWWGSGLMLVTAVVAALLNYAIGRGCLKKTVFDREDSPITRALVEMAGEAGFFGHLLIRLSPVPTMIISYLMGACHARIVPYAFAAAIAMIPQFLWVHSGTVAMVAGEEHASIARRVSIAMAFFVAAMISIWIPKEVLRRLQKRSITQVS